MAKDRRYGQKPQAESRKKVLKGAAPGNRLHPRPGRAGAERPTQQDGRNSTWSGRTLAWGSRGRGGPVLQPAWQDRRSMPTPARLGPCDGGGVGCATHNEEAGPEEHSLHLHVQVHGELDPKVVRVGEDFLEEATPLLADPPHPPRLIPRLHLQGDGGGVSAHTLGVRHPPQGAAARGAPLSARGD